MLKKRYKVRGYEIVLKDDVLNLVITQSPLISNSGLFAFNKKDFISCRRIALDLGSVTEYDSYIVILIKNIEKICKKNKIELEIINLSKDIERFISFFRKNAQDELAIKQNNWLYNHFNEVGTNFINLVKDFYLFISFLGELILKLLKLLILPHKMRWVDFPLHFVRNGVMALPISVLIVFLIGLISGYQGAVQLKQFGADTYIADLVGISLTRELSPLMVAILVAGRSGSAFAAQLGTMKVTEEIDALKSMGFDQFEFLVLPRVLAVVLAMPFLVIICNLVGVAGGLIAALTTLDVTMTGYINRLQVALSFADIFSGLIKSIIFGFIVSTIGCYKGLNVTGGADSVGKFTTASVVAGVFMIILVDAVFTFVLNSLGI